MVVIQPCGFLNGLSEFIFRQNKFLLIIMYYLEEPLNKPEWYVTADL